MSQPLRAALSIPPLENGDRLIRPEFERRYHAMPSLALVQMVTLRDHQN